MISITHEQKDELDTFSKETGISKSTLIVLALEEYRKKKMKGQK